MSDPVSILAANLASPCLAHLRGVLSLDAVEKWRVEWSEPFPSLSMEFDGKWLALGSRRAPLDEARTQIEAALGSDPWPPLVVLLGAGLGYAVDAIEAAAPPETRVLVIEPFAPAAAAMFARRDWRRLLEDGRLHVVAGPQFGGAAELWRLIDARRPPLPIEHPVLARVRPDAMAGARKVLERVTFEASANTEARETLGGRYLVNTLRNLPRILAGPDLREWTDARAGRPVVVCGAGPSLNANLVDLADYRDQVTLVAVDTSLRPILEAGLTPDLVVALDPSPLNARHLSGLTLPDSTWLVSEAAMDPAAFDSFGDRVAFFRVGANDPWPWLGAQGVDVPVLAAWGSVLTSAFALAEWLGADPIVLIGADLAFTNGQPYCRGTMFEVDWARAVLQGEALPAYWRRQLARRPLLRVTGIDGGEAETAAHLVAFRDWLVERAAKSGRQVLNLTGAGVLQGPAIRHERPDPFVPGVTRSGPMGPEGLRGQGRAAQALSEQLARLRDDRPPLSDWIASYSRSLDRAMLDMVLGQYADAGDAGRSFSSGGDAGAKAPAYVPVDGRGTRALIALPEAVAILRAARDGAAAPAWALESSAWEYVGRYVGRSFSSGMAGLVAGANAPAYVPGYYVPGHLHRLLAFDWPQPVLEELATRLIDIGARLRAIPPGTTIRQRFRPTASDDSGRSTPRGASRQALAFIGSTYATQAAVADAQASPTSRTVLDAIDAINVALESRAPSSEARLTVTMRPSDDGRAWRIASRVSPGRLPDVLRGAVLGTPNSRPRIAQVAGGMRLDVSWHTRTLDADVLHRACLGVVPHRVLTEQGLPKCLIATPGLDATAVVTPRGQRASYAVSANGTTHRTAEWPDPIVGEVHGPEGRIAWTLGSPQRLLFRLDDDAEIVAADVAFQTYSAIWWQNLVVLTTSDGVWTWQPGRPPVRIADIAPAVIVRIDGDTVDVDPLPIEAGRLTRARLERGWTINLAANEVSSRELTGPGQRWMLHEVAGRSATGFPQADCIHIALGTGAERTLIWPAPRAALWLGASLLVNTTSGEVVLFEGLGDQPELWQS